MMVFGVLHRVVECVPTFQINYVSDFRVNEFGAAAAQNLIITLTKEAVSYTKRRNRTYEPKACKLQKGNQHLKNTFMKI